MRKASAFAALLFLLGVLALGQQPRAQLTATGVGEGGFGGGISCSQSIAFIARTDGGGNNSAYGAFICGGVTDTWWSKMDVVTLFATNSATNALLNLVSSSFNPTLNGTPTFTANAGYNPTSSAGVRQYNASTAGGLYTQNSAHLSTCTIETGGGTYAEASVTLDANSAAGQNLYPYLSGSSYFRVNDNPESGGIVVSGNTTAFTLGNRSGASATQQYRGASQIGTNTTASQAPQNLGFVHGVSGAGIPHYQGLILAATFGGSLTSTDVGNLYSRLSTYLTTVHGSSC